MNYQYLRVESVGRTAVVTIDNPPVNALHPDVSDEIAAAAHEIAADLEIRTLVLTGTGRCFVAGGDIKYFTTLDQALAADMARRTQSMQRVLFELRMPVIAALNGHAVGGGCELMFACDIVVADETAQIGLTEVTLGLIPGAGGTQMVLENLPPSTARRLLYTGERVSAAEARRLGLVDSVAPAGGALPHALELAERINVNGPLAVEAAKRSANYGRRHSGDRGHELEIEEFSSVFVSDDAKEGVSAFLEKRTPVYHRA